MSSILTQAFQFLSQLPLIFAVVALICWVLLATTGGENEKRILAKIGWFCAAASLAAFVVGFAVPPVAISYHILFPKIVDGSHFAVILWTVGTGFFVLAVAAYLARTVIVRRLAQRGGQ